MSRGLKQQNRIEKTCTATTYMWNTINVTFNSQETMHTGCLESSMKVIFMSFHSFNHSWPLKIIRAKNEGFSPWCWVFLSLLCFSVFLFLSEEHEVQRSSRVRAAQNQKEGRKVWTFVINLEMYRRFVSAGINRTRVLGEHCQGWQSLIFIDFATNPRVLW